MFVSYGIVPEEKIDKISKILELKSGDHKLYLKNVSGSVTVTGTEKDVISINYEKIIQADDADDLEKGMEEVEVVFEDVDEGYFVYTGIPCTNVDLEKKSINYCFYYFVVTVFNN